MTRRLPSLRVPVLPRGAWWLEIVCVVAGYEIYNVVQAHSSGEVAAANAHGRAVEHLERVLHLDPERAMNSFATVHRWIGLTGGYCYELAHIFVTASVLVWLWRRRGPSYARLRTALLVASLLALVVFWRYPVSPPRFVAPGLTDTLVSNNILGAAHVHQGVVNLYAAMPSLHVAWATWCAAAVVLTGTSRRRHLAWGYPLFTTAVVLVTANHYILDAFAGAALMALVLAVFARRGVTLPGTTSPDVGAQRRASAGVDVAA